MFRFQKKKNPENDDMQSVKKDFDEIAAMMEMDDVESSTPFEQLVVMTLVFGKMSAKKQGTNIGNLGSASINYLGLTDYSFGDTIIVISFYNMLMVAAKMDERKFDRFRYSYTMRIKEGIHRITKLDTVDVSLMIEDRIDAYFDALSARDNDILKTIENVFEKLIIMDISGDYQDYDFDAPINLLGAAEIINVKTQVGGLFAGMPAAFNNICEMVANTY